MAIEFEQFDRHRKCPRCEKMHLNQGYFCEHCLFDFLSEEPTMQSGRF